MRESRSSHARCSELARRKRKARPRRTRDGGEDREESSTSVAAGCTCITCLRSSRDPGEKKPPVRHLRRNPARKTAYGRGATRRDATRCSVKFSNLQNPRFFSPLWDTRQVQSVQPCEASSSSGMPRGLFVSRSNGADRRIRSSNSGVDRHREISVIYTGCTPCGFSRRRNC